MPSNTGHRDYDANLLASAPVATKAQLQSGYNPDLLAEKTTPPPSKPDLEARGSSPVVQTDYERPIPIPPKVPFYRTRNGIIAIVVVLAVIIAAAVGGGVAGSRKKTITATQGGAPASASTGTPTVRATTTIGASGASTAAATTTGSVVSGNGALPGSTIYPDTGTASKSESVQTTPTGLLPSVTRIFLVNRVGTLPSMAALEGFQGN